MMAKKPKKGTAGEADAAAAPESKKGARKMLFAAVGLVVVVAAAGGGYFFLKSPSRQETNTAAHKPAAFLDIREMTINLAPQPNEPQRYLKFRVTLEVNDAKSVADIQPLLPRVEDTFQVFVRELRANDLEGSSGVYRLREELLRRVNMAVHPAKVDAVLFKDIVLQ
jgi:flagellar protein FliL